MSKYIQKGGGFILFLGYSKQISSVHVCTSNQQSIGVTVHSPLVKVDSTLKNLSVRSKPLRENSQRKWTQSLCMATVKT